jgi:hypothetical protein
MSKPTPLPWKSVAHSWCETSVIGSNGYPVCLIDIRSDFHNDDSTASEAIAEANAAYIVRAANSHHDLLEALKAIVALDDGDSPDLWHFEDEFNAARAAIAKAEA